MPAVGQGVAPQRMESALCSVGPWCKKCCRSLALVSMWRNSSCAAVCSTLSAQEPARTLSLQQPRSPSLKWGHASGTPELQCCGAAVFHRLFCPMTRMHSITGLVYFAAVRKRRSTSSAAVPQSPFAAASFPHSGGGGGGSSGVSPTGNSPRAKVTPPVRFAVDRPQSRIRLPQAQLV